MVVCLFVIAFIYIIINNMQVDAIISVLNSQKFKGKSTEEQAISMNYCNI